jgi:hypothetical protein
MSYDPRKSEAYRYGRVLSEQLAKTEPIGGLDSPQSVFAIAAFVLGMREANPSVAGCLTDTTLALIAKQAPLEVRQGVASMITLLEAAAKNPGCVW